MIFCGASRAPNELQQMIWTPEISSLVLISGKSDTLMERKSRTPQIQGVQRRSRSKLLRAFGNAGGGVSPAFPKGKQNREKKELL